MSPASVELPASVREWYVAHCDAMLAGDSAALGAMLADDFTLTHMTGYEQAREEWLADVASGEMRYHAMHDVDLVIDQGPDGPVLTARTRTEATIWGAHGTWPLQLVIHLAPHGPGWLATRTVASTWG